MSSLQAKSQGAKVRDPQYPAQRQEDEICIIQNKEKIPWMVAQQKYFTQRPDEGKSYD